VPYGPDETFPVGGAKVVRSSPGDQVTLAGAGVTLHNCLAAADQLGRHGIHARVVDLYSIKPIDTETLLEAAAATGGRLVVAEDHYPAGGIGGAVLEAFNDAGHPVQIVHLAVRSLPGSGTPRNSWRPRASPPATSPRPPATSSAPDTCGERDSGVSRGRYFRPRGDDCPGEQVAGVDVEAKEGRGRVGLHAELPDVFDVEGLHNDDVAVAPVPRWRCRTQEGYRPDTTGQ
jgi:Transketolase, C-terminal domain